MSALRAAQAEGPAAEGDGTSLVRVKGAEVKPPAKIPPEGYDGWAVKMRLEYLGGDAGDVQALRPESRRVRDRGLRPLVRVLADRQGRGLGRRGARGISRNSIPPLLVSSFWLGFFSKSWLYTAIVLVARRLQFSPNCSGTLPGGPADGGLEDPYKCFNK